MCLGDSYYFVVEVLVAQVEDLKMLFAHCGEQSDSDAPTVGYGLHHFEVLDTETFYHTVEHSATPNTPQCVNNMITAPR